MSIRLPFLRDQIGITWPFMRFRWTGATYMAALIAPLQAVVVPEPDMVFPTGTDFTLTVGDTFPALSVRLLDGNGNPLDLSTCTLTLVMRRKLTSVPLTVGGNMTILEANPAMLADGAANAQYVWQASDTQVAADYQARILLTETGTGATGHAPSNGWLNITVLPA